MPFFVVTTTHPDGDSWGQNLAAHVMCAADRAEVEAAIVNDPFARAGAGPR